MRKSKKMLLGFMVMGLVASTVLPAENSTLVPEGISVYAAENENAGNIIQGKCGDTAVYRYDNSTRTLTISGTGAMWDDSGFAKRLTQTKKIVVEKGIQSIGSYSFENLYDITDVEIADTVTTIKTNAFENIAGTVTIPSSVVKVENRAFYSAEKFIINGDVKGYDTAAFGYCEESEIVLYGDAQDLGKALYWSGNTTVTIAEGNAKCKISNGCLLSADGKQLYYCMNARDAVTIPDSVESISTAAFCSQYFSKLTLGANVKTIGAFAFEGTGVKNIETNKKLTAIGVKAFTNTRVSSVTFKGKVSLGVGAFDSSVKISQSKKFKYAQTAVSTAKIGKKNYIIKFAKVSGAKGYQINVKKGKKTYKYFTTKNSYTKKAPETLKKDYAAKKDYSLKNDAYLAQTEGAAYVTVRPYKIVKGKKAYGKWSKKMVLNANK